MSVAAGISSRALTRLLPLSARRRSAVAPSTSAVTGDTLVFVGDCSPTPPTERLPNLRRAGLGLEPGVANPSAVRFEPEINPVHEDWRSEW